MEYTTERMRLRSYVKTDNCNLYQLFTERFVRTYEHHLQMQSISDVDDYIAWYLDNAASANRTHYFTVIELRETHEFLGIVGYSFVEEMNENGLQGAVMEFEYYLLESHWGKGYMTEALRKVMETAFTSKHAVKLFAQCHKDNPGSENVMQKCGMVLSAIQPKPKDYFGVIKENVRYEITADKYALET